MRSFTACASLLKCAWLGVHSLLMLNVVAGDALEHAALLAVKQQSEAGMERAFGQLRAFYADTV